MEQPVELYRKRRPTKLSEVVGQDAAIATLRGMGPKELPHVILFSGPSGCLRGDMEIYDPVDGTTVPVRDRWGEGRPFHVVSHEAGRAVVAAAMPPRRYPQAQMYRVETAESVFYVTGGHRVCLFDGSYQTVASLVGRFSSVPLLSNWGTSQEARRQGALHYSETGVDSQVDYPVYPCSYDEQLPSDQAGVRSTAPLQAGVQELVSLQTRRSHSRLYQLTGRSSTNYSLVRSWLLSARGSLYDVASFAHDPFSNQRNQQFFAATILVDIEDQRRVQYPLSASAARGDIYLGRDRIGPLALSPPVDGMSLTGRASIVSIEEVEPDVYYDFHVPVYNNYWMGGCFHHNCGKTTLARILAAMMKIGPSDLKEMNAAEARGIDDIRDLQQHMRLSAIQGKYRAWIIDEAHKITSDGQTALLKTLEDTPPHVYFFICTTDPNKLLKTIRSRCTEIKLAAISATTLKKLVLDTATAEGKPVSDEVAAKIAELADGGARKAMVALHQIIGLPADKQMSAIIKDDPTATGFEVAQKIFGKAKWTDVAAVLRAAKDAEQDAEGIRRVIIGYAQSILLKAANRKAYEVIEAFWAPLYDIGWPGLVSRCFECVEGRS